MSPRQRTYNIISSGSFFSIYSLDGNIIDIADVNPSWYEISEDGTLNFYEPVALLSIHMHDASTSYNIGEMRCNTLIKYYSMSSISYPVRVVGDLYIQHCIDNYTEAVETRGVRNFKTQVLGDLYLNHSRNADLLSKPPTPHIHDLYSLYNNITGNLFYCGDIIDKTEATKHTELKHSELESLNV